MIFNRNMLGILWYPWGYVYTLLVLDFTGWSPMDDHTTMDGGWEWSYCLGNKHFANLKMGHRNSWFTMIYLLIAWWFSIVVCMFTRGYGPFHVNWMDTSNTSNDSLCWSVLLGFSEILQHPSRIKVRCSPYPVLFVGKMTVCLWWINSTLVS